METQQTASQLTLSSGKVVVMKDLRIEHNKKAAQAASRASGGDQALLALCMQDELIKLLLHSINGEALKGLEKEKLDSILSPREYREILKYLEEELGNAQTPKIETITI